MADFILKGCPYPLATSPHGYFYSQEGVTQIKSDLLSLIYTNPKERVMHPDFGIDLRSLIFEPADSILEAKAVAIITNGVAKWEPRIAFESIQAQVNEDNNLLHITIAFRDPQAIQDIEVLELELPLGQGVNQ